MACLNLCQFIGNAGSAPEVRTFNDGGKVANLRIAVTERYTRRDGQPGESTEWVPCVFNGKLADVAESYITKGSTIYVSGRWRTREWSDQQGTKHYQTELNVSTLQLLSSRQQQGTQQQPQAPIQPRQSAPQYAPTPAQMQAPTPPPTPAPAPAPAYPPQYPQYPQTSAAPVDNSDLPF